MRAFAFLRASAASAAVLGAVWACGSSHDSGGFETPEVDAALTSAYCDKYCNAQANAGTLQGSKAECLSSCCAGVSGGCTAEDASVATPEAGGDATSEASTCATPCGKTCCAATDACTADSTGTLVCVQKCSVGTECPTGCCAPATNLAGEPIGPYVCKPDDGTSYDCCQGISVTCSVMNTCCVADSKGNKFCALECLSDTACGSAHCLASYSFNFLSTTCGNSLGGTPKACGP